MLVSNRAQNYWALSAVAKKTLCDNKNVFGRVVEPFIGSKDLVQVVSHGHLKAQSDTTLSKGSFRLYDPRNPL